MSSNNSWGILKTLALAGMAGALVAACGGTPTRYYTLAESSASALKPSADTARYAIEMAPISLPERLARPQMVVRHTGLLQSKDRDAAAQSEVDVLEQSRWSSSFEYELRDALASGVAARLSAFDATKAGRPSGVPVYRISVQLRQFDAQPDARVDAGFGWSVRRADSDSLLACQMQWSEPVSGGIDGVAQGTQRITARLADEIARNVSALASSQAARCPA